MLNLDEQYENLYEFIKNFEILIQKNIFQEQNNEEVKHFGNEVMSLCKAKVFNITLSDLTSLNSFNELLIQTPDASKCYLITQVENFFTEIIEPSKDELYRN